MKKIFFSWTVFLALALFAKAQGTLDSGLVAHLPFNGNAIDESGNGNHGIVSGATLVQDRFGNVSSAYLFNGVTDIITIPYSASLEFADEVTFAAWINVESKTLPYLGRIVIKNSGPDNDPFGMYHGSTNYIYAQVEDYTNSVTEWLSTPDNSIQELQWEFVVTTWDGDSLKVYINCDLITVVATNIAENMTSAVSNITIGNRDVPIGITGVLGIIDDVRIYDRALSNEEVRLLGSCDSNCTVQWISNDESICYGDSILLEGSFQYASGVYHDTLVDAIGCDSIIITTLTIDSIIYWGNTLEMCDMGVPGPQIVICGGFFDLGSPPGIYTFNDTVVGSNGCDSSICQHIITINPKFTSNQSLQICSGDSIFLESNWQISSGLYYDTLNSIYGCDSVIITDLTVFDPLIYSVDTLICDGDSVYAAGAYQYEQGTYYDIISYVSGCDSIIFATNLNLAETPQVAISGPDSLCKDQEVQLLTTGAFDNYIWNNNDSSNSIFVAPAITTLYSVTAFDSCGSSQDVLLITVEPCIEPNIFLPNIFSPNSDGINDFLKAEVQGIESLHLEIYNRWGQKVFETNDIDVGWDGKDNGQYLNPGVYAYYLQVELLDGSLINESDNITLVR